jgi:hypothetical protein
MARRSVRFGVRSRMLSNVGHWMGDRWSRLHLQSLEPINPHQARVVGYGMARSPYV